MMNETFLDLLTVQNQIRFIVELNQGQLKSLTFAFELFNCKDKPNYFTSRKFWEEIFASRKPMFFVNMEPMFEAFSGPDNWAKNLYYLYRDYASKTLMDFHLFFCITHKELRSIQSSFNPKSNFLKECPAIFFY